MDFLIAVAILQSVTTILKGNAMVLLTVQMGKMNIFVVFTEQQSLAQYLVLTSFL